MLKGDNITLIQARDGWTAQCSQYLCPNLRLIVLHFSLQRVSSTLVPVSELCLKTEGISFVVEFLFSRVQVLKREGESKRNMSNGAAENGVDRQVIISLIIHLSPKRLRNSYYKWNLRFEIKTSLQWRMYIKKKMLLPIPGRRSRASGRRPARRRWWEAWRLLLCSSPSQVFAPLCRNF